MISESFIDKATRYAKKHKDYRTNKEALINAYLLEFKRNWKIQKDVSRKKEERAIRKNEKKLFV